jgi:hypothetical protein
MFNFWLASGNNIICNQLTANALRGCAAESHQYFRSLFYNDPMVRIMETSLELQARLIAQLGGSDLVTPTNWNQSVANPLCATGELLDAPGNTALEIPRPFETDAWDVSTGWDAGYAKATCPAGFTQIGMSDETQSTLGAHLALCAEAGPAVFSGKYAAALTGSGDQRRMSRTVNGSTEWSSGFWKLECGSNEYVSGISQSTGTGASFHGVLCASSPGLSNAGCTARVFDSGDNRFEGSPLANWDSGYFKGECAPYEYVAGVSISPSNRRPHALLCCSR